MDRARESLLASLLVERRLVGVEEVSRLGQELERQRTAGAAASLAALVLRERLLDADRLRALLREVEARGRTCSRCGRPALVGPAGPASCPACQAALGPLAPVAGSEDSQRLTPSFLTAAPGRFTPRPTPAPGPTPPPPPVVDREASTVRDRLATDSSGRIRAIEEEGRPTVKLEMTGLEGAPLHPSLATPPSGAGPPATPPSSSGPPSGPAPGATIPRAPTLADPGATRADDATGKRRTIGRKLGPYEIHEELGSGGMGVVYRARHATSGEVVALKVLLAGGLASERLRARFHEEARAIGKLSHESIVPILDVGEVDHVAYYTMKLIEGDLLHDLLVRGQLEPARGAEVLRDVARAAHHAHERGIVHRDLKPANVIVERATGRPYVMDFGLAKDLEHDVGLSKSGVALGTPRYMSPEQAQGRMREIDGRSDVYSLGAILYELLAGRAPFEGESQTDLMRQIVESEPAPPSAVQPGARLDLQAIALKALKKKKEERYASAEAMAQDLERALAGEVPEAQRERDEVGPAASIEASRRAVSRGPVLVAAALGLAALVVVGFGVHAFKQAREKIKRDRDLAEQRRRDEEEALAQAKRREQLTQNLEGAATKRALARSAPNAPAARALLEQATAQLAQAQKLAEEGSEAEGRVLYESALAHRDLGGPTDLDEARSDLERAAGLKGFSARAHAARGALIHRRAHDPEGARKDLEAALKPGAPPEDATGKAEEQAAAALAQGYLSLIDGDPPSARAALRQATAADAPALADSIAELEAFSYLISAPPDEPSWHALQGTRAAERGLQANRWRVDLLCELAWARALAGDLRRAETAVAAAKEACPGAPDVLVAEAWIAVRLDRESVARARIEDGRKLQPTAKSFWDAIDSRLSVALDAKKAKATPGMVGTRSLWSDLPLVYPGKLGARVEEVQAEIEEKKLDLAVEHLEALEPADPQHVSFALWRARLLLESGRTGPATEIVARVLERRADEPMALTLQGLLDARRGNFATARESLRKCVAAHPELRTPRIFLAQLCAASRDWGGVTDALQRLCDDDEGDLDAAASLSSALLESGHLGEAVDLAKRATTVQPRFAPARVAYARALRRSDRGVDALAVLDEGERLEPGLESVLREKVECLRAVGKTNEADELEKKLGK